MKNLFVKEKGISENKSYCFQISWNLPYIGSIIDTDFKLIRFDDYLFNLKFSLFSELLNFQTKLTHKTDHAGFTFDFTFIGLNIYFNIYDNRHWDCEKNDWFD